MERDQDVLITGGEDCERGFHTTESFGRGGLGRPILSKEITGRL